MKQPLSRERRIDWARILASLQTAGMSLQEVADWLEVGKSTLRGYTDPDIPSEPAYWVGHCLVLLWAERCGCRPEEVPTKRVPLSVSAMLRQLNGGSCPGRVHRP